MIEKIIEKIPYLIAPIISSCANVSTGTGGTKLKISALVAGILVKPKAIAAIVVIAMPISKPPLTCFASKILVINKPSKVNNTAGSCILPSVTKVALLGTII